jgi:DNA primase
LEVDSVTAAHAGKVLMMPGVDFGLLRREITMRQVLDQIGFEPTRRNGDQLHGPCPVHSSTSPRSDVFSVNLNNGRYYCHKCHSHGNLLELYAAVRRTTLYEAAIDLCRALGRDIPWIKRW